MCSTITGLFDNLSLHPSPFKYEETDFWHPAAVVASCSASQSDDSFGEYHDDTSLYSLKVFVGGLPKGTSEVQVRLNFRKFAIARVEMQSQSGYCFLIFRNQTACQEFVSACTTFPDGRKFLAFKKDVIFCTEEHKVEVRPFKLVDAHYGRNHGQENLPARAIFVGGLPRDTAAEVLAMNLEIRYGTVSDVAIDLDPDTMYPRGTAFVIFKHPTSAAKAIWSQTMVLKKGTKRQQHRLIELKPFLEIDHTCLLCNHVGTAVFCNHPTCMRVMCDHCWDAYHMGSPERCFHTKVTRGTYYTTRRVSS